MTNEQLTEKVFEHEKAIGKLEEDFRSINKKQDEIREIAQSTQKLAISVEKIATKVQDVDERMSDIEGSQKSKNAAIWQMVMSAIISGIGTYVISNVLR